jgi:pimeloyl-ACP methyl ester carboxylesterase
MDIKKINFLSFLILGGFILFLNVQIFNQIKKENFQELHYFYHNGGSICYEVKGIGRAIVFVHGGNMDSRIWDDQFNVFAESNRVIRYDVRGFGKSDLPQQPFSHVEDLDCLLDHLHVEKAVFVGLSLGSRIIIDFSLVHPEKVEALICAGPGLSGYPFPQESNKRIWKIIETARDRDSKKAAEMWLDDPYMKPAMENSRIKERISQIVFQNAHIWLLNPLLERPIKPSAYERITDIKIPILTIVGEKDVKEILSIADLLASRVPGAKKRVMAGAGHIINMEDPQEFNRVVADFLKSCLKKNSDRSAR